ncbi:EKC/KEOPS complex subunit TPRKB-like [Babylonia areolata]|uniref:EKC/KEOPS complex subunit TPRKB-like n=1 Tax=Babylonia areolata TaxID=304850 RepID=UPI003FD4B25E
MAEKCFPHALYPDTTITLALFRDVENAKEIRQAVMSGKFDASLLKASLVMDEFLVTVAANKAVHAQRCGKMTTKTVHSEILFNLSAGRKITEAFRKIGISDGDTAVLVAIVGSGEESRRSLETLKGLVVGRQVDLEELPSLADHPAIRKEYKLLDAELSASSAVEAIATRIAVKDVITV